MRKHGFLPKYTTFVMQDPFFVTKKWNAVFYRHECSYYTIQKEGCNAWNHCNLLRYNLHVHKISLHSPNVNNCFTLETVWNLYAFLRMPCYAYAKARWVQLYWSWFGITSYQMVALCCSVINLSMQQHYKTVLLIFPAGKAMSTCNLICKII